MADVVVVDDDESVAEAVADILVAEGHVVRIAENGERGLKLLADRLPDLIVLDVEMPVLSGPQMAQRLLIEDAGKEHIPVLLLSGVMNLSDVAARVGTPYALPKSCEMRELLDLVDRALRERIAPTPKPTPAMAAVR
jgi:DNA-binding response OmpR family regulator